MFKTSTEKKNEKGSCALGQRRPQCTAQTDWPSRTEAARAHVRFSNLTGGARGSAAQRRGERWGDDRRGPPVISNPSATAAASSPATIPATATATEARVELSVVLRL